METPLAIGEHSIYLCGASGGYNGVPTPFWGLGVGTVPELSPHLGVKGSVFSSLNAMYTPDLLERASADSPSAVSYTHLRAHET